MFENWADDFGDVLARGRRSETARVRGLTLTRCVQHQENRHRRIGTHAFTAVALGDDGRLVLSNIEARQSGVVALAHGFGIPVVATPIGGLTEQIKDRHSGLIAQSVTAAALVDAMELFLTDADLRA